MHREDLLLEDLKSLEAKELSLNLLAEQLNAEQEKCVKELEAIRRNMKLMIHEHSTESQKIQLILNKVNILESALPKKPHPILWLALGYDQQIIDS
jgi:hypothetical protein